MSARPETPIASDYLEVRGELGAALVAVTDLAIESNAPADTIQTLGNLQGGLREPFLFVVAGEVKAGKSSLLNALFGEEFCRVDVLPATDKVHVFKFGEVAREVPLHPELVEHYHPIGFLRDFNIVDTPGTNTVVSQHQRITGQFIPLADLVLFVFSVVNPWGASAWEFLEHLQRKWLKNVVFVLQQTDLRAEREVQAVVDHLKQTATGHFGRSFPIFPVSARKAFLSKTTGIDKARLWAESGFGPLEACINDTVGAGNERREKLRSICRTTQVILGDLAAEVRGEHAILDGDCVELARVLEAAQTHRGRSGMAVEAFLRALDTAFVRCEHQGEHLLKGRLSVLSRLIPGHDTRWERHFHRNFESMLHAAVARQMSHAFNLLEAETRSVWTQIRESLHANLSASTQARLGDNEVDFADQRPRLVERIETAAVEILTDETTEQQLSAALASIGSAVRRPLVVAVVVLAVACGLAAVGTIPWWATGVAFSAAAFLVAGGFAVASQRRDRALEGYRAQIAGKREKLGQTVETLIGQAIETFYARVAAIYLPLDSYVRSRGKAGEPLLQRFADLEGTLRRIATRL